MTEHPNGPRARSLMISGVYFPPQVGGISRLVEQICVALGPESVACVTGIPGTKMDAPQLAPFAVYRKPALFSANRLQMAWTLAHTLPGIILRHRPQVVQLATCDEGNLGLALQRSLRWPFIVYAYGNEILSAMDAEWDKPLLALRRATRVLAISTFTADILERAGVSPEAIRIIPLGCDADRFQSRQPRRVLRERLLGGRVDARIILTVGNLVERKGQDMVIRSLPSLSERIPDVTYVIVGSGPFKPELERIASQVGVRDRIIFAGRVPDEALPDFYALADVFAMPSRARLASHDVEGFGIVFLEAAAAGLPSVAGRSGGIEDAVVDGKTGLLVDPSDVREIGQALLRLLTDEDLRSALGQQGRERTLREYTWPIVGRRVQAILDEVVASSRGS